MLLRELVPQGHLLGERLRRLHLGTAERRRERLHLRQGVEGGAQRISGAETINRHAAAAHRCAATLGAAALGTSGLGTNGSGVGLELLDLVLQRVALLTAAQKFRFGAQQYHLRILLGV